MIWCTRNRIRMSCKNNNDFYYAITIGMNFIHILVYSSYDFFERAILLTSPGHVRFFRHMTDCEIIQFASNHPIRKTSTEWNQPGLPIAPIKCMCNYLTHIEIIRTYSNSHTLIHEKCMSITRTVVMSLPALEDVRCMALRMSFLCTLYVHMSYPIVSCRIGFYHSRWVYNYIAHSTCAIWFSYR